MAIRVRQFQRRWSDCLAQNMVLDRQRTDALAGGGEDRVAQSRRKRRYRRLTDAAPEIAARHNHGLDPWRVGHAQHLVVVEVRLLDAAVLDGDLASKRRAQSKND